MLPPTRFIGRGMLVGGPQYAAEGAGKSEKALNDGTQRPGHQHFMQAFAGAFPMQQHYTDAASKSGHVSRTSDIPKPMHPVQALDRGRP